MNCPYCGGEMMAGFVSALRDDVYWRPATRNLREWASRYFNEGLLLHEKWHERAEAWYCPACRKIVVDLAKQTEEGPICPN